MPAHVSRGRRSGQRPRWLPRKLARLERRERLGSDAAHRGGGLHLCDQQRARFQETFGNEEIHAGLIIIVPQVVPALQRDLFTLVLEAVAGGEEVLNEVIEISIEGDEAVLTRYSLPAN